MVISMTKRKMKDSGIEWIGEIPEDWEVLPNKYLMNKKKIIKNKYKGEDILSLTKNGVIVRDFSDGGKMPASFDGYQIINKGNLLLCLFDYDVTPRTVGIIKSDGLTSPAYSQYVTTNIADTKYYYYYYLLLDYTKELLHLSKNLRSSFNEFEFSNIVAPNPSITEQKKISLFLDNKFLKINNFKDTIESQIQSLEDYKKSIITEAVTKGLDKDVPMKDSGIEWIGQIPEHWKIEKLKYLTSFHNGDRGTNYPSGNDMVDKGIYFLTSNNIHGVYLDTSIKNSKFITLERYNLLSGAKIQINDIIFCLRGSVGNCSINKSLSEGTISSSLMVIRPLIIHPDLLNYCLQSYIKDYEVYKYTNGAVAMNLSAMNVQNFKIPLPIESEQKQIANYLDKKCKTIDESIKAKKKQLEILEEYKKSLIYEYVTGKKEVK